MGYSCVQLNDLPDEMLLMIFKKLNNVELFYSLIGVHERLDQILHDFLFTNTLTLLENFSSNHICSLSLPILDRFCLEILPNIEHEIKWLNLEGPSMERILSSGNYLNLSGLGIYNITKQNALQFVTDETLLTDMYKNQISSLVIQTNGHDYFPYDLNALIITNIIKMIPNLKCLNFDASDVWFQTISHHSILLSVSSSTLSELYIRVHSVDDCLHLLDGRFDQLRVFNVKIMTSVFGSVAKIDKEKSLNLRRFSLFFIFKIDFYEELVIPLVRRMLNLEELHLYLKCSSKKSFIDGNDLKANIINYLPGLKRFVFNIYSFINDYDKMNLLTNDDIQNTFRKFPNNKIISCIDYFPNKNEGQCHIYSYPFTLINYERITNNFQDGLFTYVRKVSLFDEHAFEHKFFLRIRKSFPFMEDLTVINWKPQNKKSESADENLSLIHYHHLTCLDLTEVHDDYIEEFLLDTNTSLPFNLYLHVHYESIRRITHDFQRIETRINCSKINCIYFTDHNSRTSKYLKKYFLSTARM